MSDRPAEVLLVEDRDDDAELTRIGLAEAGVPVRMHHVGDGEECLAFLRRERGFESAPTPDLILLDLNMPRMDGREVLAAIAADERLRHLPVVVLTTSAADVDVQAAYALRCSSYVVKPLDYGRFAEVLRVICEYWFGVVTLPSRDR